MSEVISTLTPRPKTWTKVSAYLLFTDTLSEWKEKKKRKKNALDKD